MNCSCNHQRQPSAATISIKTVSCIYQLQPSASTISCDHQQQNHELCFYQLQPSASTISCAHQHQNHELNLPVATISFNHQLRPSASKP
jgi:hypothetical protein